MKLPAWLTWERAATFFVDTSIVLGVLTLAWAARYAYITGMWASLLPG